MVNFNELLNKFTAMVTADKVTNTAELFKYDKAVLGEGGDEETVTHFFNINTGELIEKFPYGEGWVIGIDVQEYVNLKNEANKEYQMPTMFNKSKDENKERFVYNYIVNNSDTLYKMQMTVEELYVRAFLTTIRELENYENGTLLDYNSQYTNTHFTELQYDPDNLQSVIAYSDHPREVLHKPPAYPEYSSAAGAYQFMQNGWPKGIGFSPLVQDKEAIKRIKYRGVYTDLIKGNIKKVLNSTRIAQEWASFNNYSLSLKIIIYRNNIIRELKNNSEIYTPIGKLLEQ